MKTALVILANDAEEAEAVITIDCLRRGGVKVTVGGLTGREPVNCISGTRIIPDEALCDAAHRAYDAIIIPGGPGAQKIAECGKCGELLRKHVDEKKILAAICGGPIVLKAHGIKAGCITAHQSKKEELQGAGYRWCNDDVCISENIVTSKGPGTAFPFALKLVEMLSGTEKAKGLIEPLSLKV